MKVKQVLGISLFSLVLGFGFVACSDDDDDNNPTTPNISAVAGTWKYTKTKAVVDIEDAEVKQKVIDYIEQMPNEKIGTYVLKLDGTYTAKSSISEQEKDGTFTFDGSKVVFDKQLPNSLAFANDSLSDSNNVKDAVIEALELEAEQVKSADALQMFVRITR